MAIQPIFDPLKYQGRWYEIARYDFYFENNCNGAIADYKYDTSKNILYITNTCLKDNISIDTKKAVGIPINQSMSHFTVQFDNNPIAGDYRVIWTDYLNFSIVSTKNKDLLWILSRTETMSPLIIPNLFKLLEYFGFDPYKLKFNKNVIN